MERESVINTNNIISTIELNRIQSKSTKLELTIIIIGDSIKFIPSIKIDFRVVLFNSLTQFLSFCHTCQILYHI